MARQLASAASRVVHIDTSVKVLQYIAPHVTGKAPPPRHGSARAGVASAANCAARAGATRAGGGRRLGKKARRVCEGVRARPTLTRARVGRSQARCASMRTGRRSRQPRARSSAWRRSRTAEGPAGAERRRGLPGLSGGGACRAERRRGLQGLWLARGDFWLGPGGLLGLQTASWAAPGAASGAASRGGLRGVRGSRLKGWGGLRTLSRTQARSGGAVRDKKRDAAAAAEPTAGDGQLHGL
eukprot:4594028-Prymnesium_polylepis.1